MEMEGPWAAQVGTENKYQYNGKEINEDWGVNLSDYGARWYDAAVGRWWSVDPLAEKMQNWSPYNYVANTPVNGIDPDGRFVYFIFYTSGGEFEAAAHTRKKEIESFSEFNVKTDHVYLINISDLGSLSTEVNSSLSDAKEKGYGKTAEVSFYSHGGVDGPAGDEETSKHNLKDVTGHAIDNKQMSPEGWASINFNFDEDRSIACFYGCRQSEFALKFLALTNARATGGFGAGSGDSERYDKFESNWFTFEGEAIYYLDGFGVMLYKRSSPGQSYGFNAANSDEWNKNVERMYNTSVDENFSTNVGLNPSGKFFGHKYAEERQ